ncbi:MAG: YceH family protein [Puniceicoccales bacterium]
MELELSPEEIRVLGCLIEKERTTPEHYPLTLNSLRLACNQKSSRDPVVDYDEDEVASALDALQHKGLVYFVRQSGARATKYRHDLSSKWSLTVAETSLLAVLFLRGPQTLGELRSRTDRMHAFNGLGEVEDTLGGLMEHEDGPFVREQAARKSGQKERRFEHVWLVVGEPETSLDQAINEALPTDMAHGGVVDSLRAEVDALQARLSSLEEKFAAFEEQFR